MPFYVRGSTYVEKKCVIHGYAIQILTVKTCKGLHCNNS